MSEQLDGFTFLQPGERPGATPPSATPPIETPPATPPVTPPVDTPPPATPPVATPPVETPPATPPVETPATPPVATPPVATPPAQPTYSHEYVEKLDQFVRDGGDPKLFLETQGRDYDAMPDEVAAKELIRKEYPRATSDMVDAYFQTRYKLDPELYTAQEIATSQMLLQGDGDKYRAAAKAEQAKYAVAPGVTAAAQAEAQRAIWESHATPALAQFNALNLTYGEGETAGTLEFALTSKAGLEPLAKDGASLYQRWVGADGAPDINKLYRDMALLDNYQAILTKVAANERAKGIELGKTQGGQSIINKLENQSRPEQNPSGTGGQRDPFANVLADNNDGFFTRKSRG